MHTLSNLETLQASGGNDFFYAYTKMAFNLGLQLANDGALYVEFAKTLNLLPIAGDDDVGIWGVCILATAIGAPIMAGALTAKREYKARYQDS